MPRAVQGGLTALGLLALAAWPGQAMAQPAVGQSAIAKASAKPAAAAAATAASPKRYGDFIVRCSQTKSVAPCDMYEERGNKQTGQRLIGFSIGYMPSASRYIMQLAVPLGVAIDKGVTITSGKLTSPAMPYRRCDQAGCYVEAAIDKSLIDVFGKMGSDARIKVAADGGKVYSYTFSFDGFTAAHDDMVSENKAKAAPPDSASDAK
jgi:invasion protein IalB